MTDFQVPRGINLTTDVSPAVNKSSMKNSRYSKTFPNTKAAAYYNQFHQLICLSKYNERDYATANFTDYKNPKVVKMISLLEHELTHWIDHHATLWGHNDLVLLFNALNARANQNEHEFWRIKQYDGAYRSDSFVDYFTEVYNPIYGNEKQPWKQLITSGVRFSNEGKVLMDKPLLFLRFMSLANEHIARTPVSIAAILETNAIHAEYQIEFSALSALDIVDKKLREQELKAELISLLYNPHLTLYSVIAHLTANLNNQNDIIWTYNTTSSLGTIVLNIPDFLFATMKIAEINDADWQNRYKSMRDVMDKGFTFYNLLVNNISVNGKCNYEIDKVLSASGLPKKVELEALVVAEMEKKLSRLIDGPFKNMAVDALKFGIELFQKRGLDGKNEGVRDFILKKKRMPFIIFGDTLIDTDRLKPNGILDKLRRGEDLSRAEKYFILDELDAQFSDFVNTCGV